jgi:hypothetical protein
MLGVSSWMWVLLGGVAPCRWLARTAIWAFCVDRLNRTVVDKAEVQDLRGAPAGLSYAEKALSAQDRPTACARNPGQDSGVAAGREG